MFIDVTQEFEAPALHGQAQFALISSERQQEAAPVVGCERPDVRREVVESRGLLFL